MLYFYWDLHFRDVFKDINADVPFNGNYVEEK